MSQENQENAIVRRIQSAAWNKYLALDSETTAILSASGERCNILVPEVGKAGIDGGHGRLILFVLDASTSMKVHTESVIRGYNSLLDRMNENPETTRTTLIHTVDIYGKVISPLGTLFESVRLDQNNYNPSQGNQTPLRDSLINASTQLVHEIQRQFDNYKIINGIVMTITDGVDNLSKYTQAQTRRVIEAVRKTKNSIFIGAGLGNEDFFVKEFGYIGIPREFVVSGTDIEGMFHLLGDVTTSSTSPNSFRALAIRGLPTQRLK